MFSKHKDSQSLQGRACLFSRQSHKEEQSLSAHAKDIYGKGIASVAQRACWRSLTITTSHVMLTLTTSRRPKV